MLGRLLRVVRHLLTPHGVARRHFTPEVLDAVERAIAESEVHHRGEILFAVETEIEIGALLRGVTARQRALEAFEHLGVDDTEERSGVLVFVQMVDRQVEIVPDRGLLQQVAEDCWQEIARELESGIARGAYLEASLTAISRIGALLARHLPAYPRNPNELPDRPMLI